MAGPQPDVDVSSLSEQEQKLYRLYGKLPTRKDLLSNKLKERKYFDSGDYALSKAGRAPKQSVGTTIPNPDMVPHAATTAGSPGASPAPGPPSASYFGSSPAMGVPVPSSPSHGHRSSFSGSIHDTGSRSSFPVATGMPGSSPGGEPTSSLAREQVSSADVLLG